MGFTIQNIAFDCADPYELARFWSGVTGHPLHEDDVPGDPVAIVCRPEEPMLYFQRVPESKTVKNRVHICLRPEAPREVEAERLLKLGATIAEDHREPDGSGHIVFADPEGNEFCLVRSTAERPEAPDTPVAKAAEAVTSTLVWRDGGTDLWPLLRDPSATDTVAHGLAAGFTGSIDVVLGPDPGGVLFGPLVARILGVPFAPVCRDRDFFFQGPHETVTASLTPADPGAKELIVHRAALADGARVLLVDDWSESGSTVMGVAEAVTSTGARLAAISFLVDSLRDDIRERLRRKGVAVHGLAAPADLRRTASSV